jgi:hypothetical protein
MDYPVIFIAASCLLAIGFACGRHGGERSLRHKLRARLDAIRMSGSPWVRDLAAHRQDDGSYNFYANNGRGNTSQLLDRALEADPIAPPTVCRSCGRSVDLDTSATGTRAKCGICGSVYEMRSGSLLWAMTSGPDDPDFFRP